MHRYLIIYGSIGGGLISRLGIGWFSYRSASDDLILTTVYKSTNTLKDLAESLTASYNSSTNIVTFTKILSEYEIYLFIEIA